MTREEMAAYLDRMTRGSHRWSIEHVIIRADGTPTGRVIRSSPRPPIVVNTANGRNPPSSAPSEDDEDHRG